MANSAFRALNHAQYRLYLSGQVISVIGTWIQTTALNWLVYELTGSVLMLGILNLVSGTIAIPLALFGGVIADRYPKKKLIMVLQAVMLGQAFVFFGLLWLQKITLWQIFALEAVLAIARSFDFPARETFLFEITEANDLTSAIGLDKAVANIGRMIGPAIAGVLIALSGEATAFLLNAISYIAILALLAFIRPPMRNMGSVTKKRTKAALQEGIQYVIQDRHIGGLILLVAASAFFSMSFMVILPELVTTNFDAATMQRIHIFCRQLVSSGQCQSPEAVLYGIMLSAVGAGSLVGAFILASNYTMTDYRKWLLISSILFPIGLIGLGISQTFLISVVILILLSVGRLLQHTIVSTQLQLTAPENLRGRVMSFYTIATQSMLKIGGVQASFLTVWLGAATTLYVTNGLALVLSVFILIMLHKHSNNILANHTTS